MPLSRLCYWLLLLVLVTWITPACAEAEDSENLVQVELSTVGVDAQSGTPVALLREPESGEVVPIFIGINEAEAILRALHEVETPRPMTHDLIQELLASMDAEIDRIVVHSLEEGTYYGRIELRVDGEEDARIVDTRPSDGFAIAARTGARIEVSQEILQTELDFDFHAPEGDENVVQAAGITVVEAESTLLEEMDLPTDREGVLISAVEGQPAAAGLEPGMLILEVNGNSIANPMDFLDALRETPSDEKAQLKVFGRDGEQDLEVPTDVPDAPDRETL